MKKFIILIACFLSSIYLQADWKHRVALYTMTGRYEYADKLFIGRTNGLTIFDKTNNDYIHYTPINSILKGSNVNTILKLSDSEALVSTEKGLSMIVNGELTNEPDICQTYPDEDSRFLYKSDDGSIWTFSSKKVHRYNNDGWNTYDLSDSVNFNFDIYELYIEGNHYWALFNDMTLTSTTFYNPDYIDLRTKLAILDDNGIKNVFLTKEVFPYRQGDVKFTSIVDTIFLKNTAGVYTYIDNGWTQTYRFDASDSLKPNYYVDFMKDGKGNIWYYVSNDEQHICHPASYNIESGIVTEHLTDAPDSWIANLSIMPDGTVEAHTTKNVYFFKNGEWEVIPITEFGLPEGTGFSAPYLIDDVLHVTIHYSTGSLKYGDVYNLETKKLFQLSNDKFPYLTIIQCVVNKHGKGIFEGHNSYMEGLKYEADSSFVKPNLVSNVPQFLPAQDGNIYFNKLRVDNTLFNPYLTTWSGNDLVNINMGFLDKPDRDIKHFDTYDNYLIALGEYDIGNDSLNTTLSVYNTDNADLKTYDKDNSCMPDYYYERIGLLMIPHDTVPSYTAMDKDFNVWLKTSEGLIKFTPAGCEFFDMLKDSTGKNLYFNNMYYDKTYNELIFMDYYRKLFIYSINSNSWYIPDMNFSGINGKITKLKKLLDNCVWASDDLGYLYKYNGNGTFKTINLEIFNKINLGLAINDFSLDVNGNIHLGTDVGLLSNMLPNNVENNEADSRQMLINPNPASDYVNIKIDSQNSIDKIQNLKLINSVGVEFVLPLNYTSEFIRLDISSLPQGVYFIIINGKIGKFVKIAK